jgi:PTS system mannose-specific IIA component
MIGVVVAAHGHLAEELIRTAEAVVGRLDQTVPVSVVSSAPDVKGLLADAIRKVDTGDGVLVLADLLGGSPCNICLSMADGKQVEVVTGVNLPMLLKLVSLRSNGKTVALVAHELAEAGQRSIVDATEMLRRTMT